MRVLSLRAQEVRYRARETYEIPMVYAEVYDRSSGAPVGVGFWGGMTDRVIRLTDGWTGERRALFFYGAGSFLDVTDVTAEPGLQVQSIRVTLSNLVSEVRSAFRAYESRNAQAALYYRCIDPLTNKEVGVECDFIGFVSASDSSRPPLGGGSESTLEVEIESTARLLTLSSALKKSNETQLARAPTDDIRRHKASIADVAPPWGTRTQKFR